MADPLFLQFHTLTSYPAALLNRDDAGFAKRLPFGGTIRTRISSQCLKYHWRHFEGRNALSEVGAPRSVRSRATFSRLVAQPLVEEGYPVRLVAPLAAALQAQVFSDGKYKRDAFDAMAQSAEPEALLGALESKQVTILGDPEVKYLRDLVREKLGALSDLHGAAGGSEPLPAEAVGRVYETAMAADKKLRANLKGLKLAAGLDAALFGRMVTSDALSRGDAALHVAHAFTTHAEESESDYFSAVDELTAGEGELGSGHLNSQELTSGLFYSYVVIDAPLLVANLEGCPRGAWASADRSLAAEVARRFTMLATTVSPGAKLGSTAPHAWASVLLVEAGPEQPRTLANAFQKAVPTAGGVLEQSCRALGEHLRGMDQMYGRQGERRLAAACAVGDVGAERLTVPEIAAWAAQKIEG